MYRCCEIRIMLPPIETDLFGLVYRTDQQANSDGQQLDIGQRDTDVSRDYQALIQYPIQDVDQVRCSRDCRDSFHIKGRLFIAYKTNSHLGFLLEQRANAEVIAST